MFIILKRNWGKINCNYMIKKKLWQKGQSILHPLVEKYTVGEDCLFDKELMPYDIKATLAHAQGLVKIRILRRVEFKKIETGLLQLKRDLESGKVVIKIEDEDCHTVIENYLVAKIGGVGKKVHTGRSRNDQVLVALRLYEKDNLQKIKDLALNLASELLKKAKKYEFVPMPGYSHTQQAMISSVGHYYAALVESLLDDIVFLEFVKDHVDKSPLGSAAGFGVSLPLARESAAKELGFAGVLVNSLYCQNSKGKFESIFLEALTQIMFTLGKLANDMLLFTSQEFDFFVVDQKLTTGSSIMPQKKNLDALELLRGYVSQVEANQILVKNLVKNLISGYNRDTQLIKKPLMESVKIVSDSLQIAKLYVAGLTPKAGVIQKKINPNIFAADVANDLVIKRGVAFRDAYLQALDKLNKIKMDPIKNIKSKKSLGAPGNLSLVRYKKRLGAYTSLTNVATGL